MIEITPEIALDERELTERFVRASGPGGQNVNKVSTAVQLRIDARCSPSLPDDVRARLERLAGGQMTGDGEIVIIAQRYRTQERNRQDALDRLVTLIRRAAQPPTPRTPTKPTRASRQRRLDAKRRSATTKALRSTPRHDLGCVCGQHFCRMRFGTSRSPYATIRYIGPKDS